MARHPATPRAARMPRGHCAALLAVALCAQLAAAAPGLSPPGASQSYTPDSALCTSASGTGGVLAECDPPAADLPRAAFAAGAFDGGAPDGAETNANVPVSNAAGVDPCPDVALTGREGAGTVEAQIGACINAVRANPKAFSYPCYTSTWLPQAAATNRRPLVIAGTTPAGQLAAAARAHSGDMASKNYFSHTSASGRSPFQRIAAAGFVGSPQAENIAAGYGSVRKLVVGGWMCSSGHRANLLSCKTNTVGAGYGYSAASKYKHYYTTDHGCNAFNTCNTCY